jgi:hypothetical protein
LLEAALDAGQSQQALGHGGEGEEVLAAVVEEGTVADVVAGGEELLAAGRPDGEGEAAEDVIQAGWPPTEPRSHQDGGVGQVCGVDQAEGAGEILAVIQAEIGYKAAGVVWTPERLPVEAVFREEAGEGAAERDCGI